jgi:hypothetical protein
VSYEALMVTTTRDRVTWVTEGYGAVGSTEQGFIQLMLYRSGLLANNKQYVSWSPCWRPADNGVSPYHVGKFYKCELFVPNPADPELTQRQLEAAAFNYFKILSPKSDLQLVDTEDGNTDLVLNGIEVGSYGFRKHKGFSWVYGTGLAEPRFSMANAATKE